MNAAGSQPTKASTQPHLGFPRDRHEVLRLALKSRLQRFADPSGKSVVPGCFNQDAPNVRIPGLGKPATML